MVAVGVEHRELSGFGRTRMQVIEDACAATLGKFLTDNVQTGSRVITDGWSGYRSIVTDLGYIHQPRNQSAARRAVQDPGDLLPASSPPSRFVGETVAAEHPSGFDST